MTDNTIKRTIALDRGYFVDAYYNANTYTLTVEMYTNSNPRVIIYTQKFCAPLKDFIAKAVEEANKMTDAYDSAVRVFEER